MIIDILIERFKENSLNPAIVWKESTLTYNNLLDKIKEARVFVKVNQIKKGEVVALNGDFTPMGIAILLVLIENKNIILPAHESNQKNLDDKYLLAGVKYEIIIDLVKDTCSVNVHNHKISHAYYDYLKQKDVSGLVLFTSGTSGKPKAAVHDFEELLKKFKIRKSALRTINFLLFDHWGGLNTLFHTISNCGVVMALSDRKPISICNFIEKYKIELLPVSPSFMNLLIFSEMYKKFDLSSLKLITYGTEPMSQNTLNKSKEIFPNIKFHQTYGLIELGVLRSKSKSDNSLWVKLGGEGYDIRVINNMLEIKAKSAMLGYLNAESPFTIDGYFRTGDLVEVEGEYFKILGRNSEIINVGGEKVFPQEVENVLLSHSEVDDVLVYGQANPILGMTVCAKIRCSSKTETKSFKKELKLLCKDRLAPFKRPIKYIFTNESLSSNRFKKQRA